MTEISGYEDGEFPGTRSVGFESDSAGSDSSESYEEEGISDMIVKMLLKFHGFSGYQSMQHAFSNK